MSRPMRIFILALCALLASATVVMASPKIDFSKTEVVFEDVEEGDQLTAKFAFKNKGDLNLIIDEVSPSCGCTVAKFTEVTKPGASGNVTLHLDTDGIVGHFRKTATVATNDPDNPFVTVVMLGETMSAVKVEGGRRVELFGCLGQDINAQVKLTSPKGGPVLITGVKNPLSDYCSVQLERLNGGDAYYLHIKAKTDRPARYAGQVFLQVPGSPDVSLWLVADIRGAVSIRPEIVFFGSVNKDKLKGVARSVEVAKACAETLTEPELTYDEEKFKIQRHWEKKNAVMLLVITPRPENLEKGPFRSELKINTGKFVFTVPMRGTIY